MKTGWLWAPTPALVTAATCTRYIDSGNSPSNSTHSVSPSTLLLIICWDSFPTHHTCTTQKQTSGITILPSGHWKAPYKGFTGLTLYSSMSSSGTSGGGGCQDTRTVELLLNCTTLTPWGGPLSTKSRNMMGKCQNINITTKVWG